MFVFINVIYFLNLKKFLLSFFSKTQLSNRYKAIGLKRRYVQLRANPLWVYNSVKHALESGIQVKQTHTKIPAVGTTTTRMQVIPLLYPLLLISYPTFECVFNWMLNHQGLALNWSNAYSNPLPCIILEVGS